MLVGSFPLNSFSHLTKRSVIKINMLILAKKKKMPFKAKQKKHNFSRFKPPPYNILYKEAIF